MNLLPLTEKRIIRNEYYRRLAVVALNLFAILIVIAVLPVAVSYVASGYEIVDLRQSLDLISKVNVNEGVGNNIKIIQDANNRLDILNSDYGQGLNSPLTAIFSFIMSGRQRIHLTLISYDKIDIKNGEEKKTGHRVVLNGVADSRDGLQNFVKELLQSGKFATVDLPISDLIESKDINFTITTMIAK